MMTLRRFPGSPTPLLAVMALVFVAQDALTQTPDRDAEDVYRVQAGDVLQVSVWKETELQREVVVRPDGGISFPLAGDIQASGLSVAELQREITTRLTRLIREPEVSVSVQQFSGNRIYVIGQVNSPGQFVVNPRVDVMQALSMAQGTTPFAAVGNIIILRRRPDDTQIAIPFRYDDVIRGRDLAQNIVLRSGDVVVVP